MIDQPLAARLAREGFELWEAGRLEESCAYYVKALEVVDPDHWACPVYHGEYGGVLSSMGKTAEATVQFEKAVASELAHGELESSSGVLTARYFLADHLVRAGAPARALETLAPALRAAPDDWLICLVHAEALWAMGEATASRAAARRSIAKAPTFEKRAELSEHLCEILGAPQVAVPQVAPTGNYRSASPSM
jgi:tetratricopeptide (TPR) repeat protein